VTSALGRAEPDATADGGRDADFAGPANVAQSAGAQVQISRVASDITKTTLAHAPSSNGGEDARALALIPADEENGTRNSKDNVARRSAQL